MPLTRNLLLWASRQDWLKDRLMRRRFMRRSVRRFMPGESVEDALTAADGLRGRGVASVLTALGENVESPEEAEDVTEHYLDALDRIRARGLDAHLSVKPTQLGLDFGVEGTTSNLRTIVEHAAGLANFVWIDMESSDYVDPTLEIFRKLRAEHPNVGICLQSYLRRTAGDIEALLPLRPTIRLVKGAYDEPPEIAYRKKRRVDAAYLEHADTLLGQLDGDGGGTRVAFATHDIELIAAIRRRAEAAGRPPEAYEVQMLYGIQRDAQVRLARQGHRVRVLISYGDAWFPWFMRRLAERPANLFFLARQLLAG